MIGEGECKAAVVLKGEFIRWDGGDDHQGWAHSNRLYEIVWVGDEGPLHYPLEQTD